MYKLPIKTDLETKGILKKALIANAQLAELRGTLKQLPNPRIILNAITMREAKESSGIENILTTYDDLYKEMSIGNSGNPNAKEVLNYRTAISDACSMVREKGFISTNMLIGVHGIIEPQRRGIRKIEGTVIKNTSTNEVVHTPPQKEGEILEYMSNLEHYINDSSDSVDPLIRMGLIYLQFEMIHPFYDGNGRIGRVLNLMYLNLAGKLEAPILYLSKYIIDNKKEYYTLLRNANKSEDAIPKFIEYMLAAVHVMSGETMLLIENLLESMALTRETIKKQAPRIYSRELVDSIFYEFYTKNEFIQKEMGVSRNSATKYLKQLEAIGVLKSEQIGREVIYKNVRLFEKAI